MLSMRRGGLCQFFALGAGLLIFSSQVAGQSPVEKSRDSSEFLRIARSEISSRLDCPEAFRYLKSLPDARQLDVARAIIKDTDGRIAYLGANLLVERGFLTEAVPVLARLIATGAVERDMAGRIGYEWIHGEDETLFLRMSILINRYLLAHLQQYRGPDRVRVERVLMGGLLEPSDRAFSKAAAAMLIRDWESQLRQPPRHRCE